MAERQITRAALLMNLGSPTSTMVKDVKRYLHEFLMDERVIDYPFVFRKMLVDGIIVPFRAPRSAEAYRRIWWPDGSPLIVITRQLVAELSARVDIPVEWCMRYGEPRPDRVMDALSENYPALQEVLLIPLYPHYAMSSYETAVAYARYWHRKKHYRFKLFVLKPFYDDADYIEVLSRHIQDFLKPDHHLLFSYHGVPERHIRKSDVTHHHCLQRADCCETSSPAHVYCYRHQVFTTTRLVAARLQLRPDHYELSFQSRLGKEPWLRPYTAQRLEELPAEGKKRLQVVCPAFVSDCLETLEEIEQEGKKIFMEHGGESFQMIPCLNTIPAWITLLQKWIHQFTAGEDTMIWDEQRLQQAV